MSVRRRAARKNIFPIFAITPIALHSSSPATRPVRQSNGGRQAFPHLLCTLYSRQATPHSYVHFMHSSECKRLQRGVRAAEKRTSKGKRGEGVARRNIEEGTRLPGGCIQRAGKGEDGGAASVDGRTRSKATEGKCYAIKRLHIKS